MNFLFALILFAQVEPIDIPRIYNVEWRIVDNATRIKIGHLYTKKYGCWAVANALAGLGVEQPPDKPFPDNNASGFHAWRKRYSYGWGNYFKLAKCRPVGYYYAREGATGFQKPFLAFKYYAENFLATLIIYRNRNVTNGGAYRKRWVGENDYCERFDELRDYYALELIKYRHR